MLGILNRLLLKLKIATKFRKKIHIGQEVFIHKNPTFIVRTIGEGQGVFIHDGVYIGRDVNIHTASKIVISKNCVISDYVYMSTLAHGIDPEQGPILSQPDIDKGSIVLCENVFLGFNTKIMPGVTLGEWTIVGTGAVVTRSFPGYCIIAGNPARIIKKYNHSSHQWEAYNDDGL
jgi:acetyltransferase-like isoleucine patch superfamily enzyme